MVTQVRCAGVRANVQKKEGEDSKQTRGKAKDGRGGKVAEWKRQGYREESN